MICPQCKSINKDGDEKCRICKSNIKSGHSAEIVNDVNKESILNDGDIPQKGKLPVFIHFLFIISAALLYLPDFIHVGNPLVSIIMLGSGFLLLLISLILLIIFSFKIKNYSAAIIYLIFFLAIIIMNVFSYYRTRDFYETIDRAQTAFESGQREDILKYAQSALTKGDMSSNTQQGIAYFWLAVGKYSNYDNTGGEIAAAKAVSLDSSLKVQVEQLNSLAAHNFKFGTLINQAQTAWQNNQTSEIIKYSQEALSISSSTDYDVAIANYWLGIGYYKNNQIDLAEKTELISIGLNSDNVGPYVTLAAIKLAQNNLVDAKIYAQKALDIDSNYAWAQNSMGVVLLDENKPQEAVKYFQKAVELAPDTQIFKDNLNIAQNSK